MPFFGSLSENRGSSHLRIKTQIAITEVDPRLNQTEIQSIDSSYIFKRKTFDLSLVVLLFLPMA